MAVTLNPRAYKYAKELIDEGKFVFDERDAWSEHRPSAQEENEFIRLHGFAEYGKWYLGIKTKSPRTPRDTMNSPMGISRRSIAAACSRQKAAPANTSILTSRARPIICMD